MKLLVITQYFRPENFRINDLVEGLLERGHDVTVLTGLPNYPSGRFSSGFGLFGPYRSRYGEADVIRVPLIRRGKSRSINLVLNYLSFAFAASIIGPWRCKGRFDAIFVFAPSPATVGIPARIIGWLKSAPIFFWVQDLWPESLSATRAISSPFILKSVGKMVRWIYKGSACILVQSEAFIPSIMKFGVPVEKIRYFPNSAEYLYQAPACLEEWKGPVLPTGFRIMFAGNIGAAQSMKTIVQAAALLKEYPEIHWIIVGDGRLASWLKNEVMTCDLTHQVHMMGHFPTKDMPQWFSQADVLLVTLRQDPVFALTIPSKIQSYLACGKPIVGSLDGEGARIIETSGAGIACPAENAQSLAEAVLELYKMSPIERQHRGKTGHTYYREHFDRTRLLSLLENWLKETSMEKSDA